MSKHLFSVFCCVIVLATSFICNADLVENRKKFRPTADGDKYPPTGGDKDCKPYGKKDCDCKPYGKKDCDDDKDRPPRKPLHKLKQKLKWKDLCKIPKVKGPKKEKPKDKVRASGFVDTRDKDCDGEDCPPRFPLLKPLKDKLVWKEPLLKLPVKKIKNKLKHKLAVNQLSEGCGIIAVLTAIEAYVTSSLALLLPNLFSMTTTTLTSTSSLTCTASTTACAGRRRRAIVEDLLDHLYETDDNESGAVISDSKDYFNPSFYEDAPDYSDPMGTPRFNPSFYDDAPNYSDPSFYDDAPIYSDPELLEGSIEDPSTTDLTYGEDGEKMMDQLMMIRQFPDDQLAQFLQELGFNTIVVTETTTTSTTITSYPVCSSQGTLPQC